MMLQGITEAALEDIARRTEGFSGRGISKLMLNLQGAVYAEPGCMLTAALLQEVVAREVAKNDTKTKGSSSWLPDSPGRRASPSRRPTADVDGTREAFE